MRVFPPKGAYPFHIEPQPTNSRSVDTSEQWKTRADQRCTDPYIGIEIRVRVDGWR